MGEVVEAVGAAGHGVPAVSSTRRWGIDPTRTNRGSVKLLLRLAAAESRSRVVRRVLRTAHNALGLLLGSDFRCRKFGAGLYLPHPYGIVVHAAVVIGDRCTVFQHVTIGETTTRPGVPVLGDDVVVGAGAVILGGISIGDGARIGANAVVVDDVPAGSVVVGIPGYVVNR